MQRARAISPAWRAIPASSGPGYARAAPGTGFACPAPATHPARSPQEAEDTGGARHYPRSMRHRLCPAAAAAGLAVLLLTGCNGSDGPPPEEPSTVHPTSAPTSQTPTATEEPSEPATNVSSAVENLAERLDIPADDIQVGPLEPVTWSDGSLGCPRPGQSYPQALTDGYRVVLTAGGQEYAYHAGADGELFYCADPQEPASTADVS